MWKQAATVVALLRSMAAERPPALGEKGEDGCRDGGIFRRRALAFNENAGDSDRLHGRARLELVGGGGAAVSNR